MKQDLTTRDKVDQIVTAFLSEDWDNCGGKADTIQGQVENFIDQLNYVVSEEIVKAYDHGYKTGLSNAKVISDEYQEEARHVHQWREASTGGEYCKDCGDIKIPGVYE